MYTPLKFKPWKHKRLVTGFYKLNKEDKDEEHLCTGNRRTRIWNTYALAVGSDCNPMVKAIVVPVLIGSSQSHRSHHRHL